jgi:hypothetical protein
MGAWFALDVYHWLKNHFEHTRWYHPVTRLKWKLVSVLSDIVLILTQDRCTVCVERTIGSEIIWMHLMELLGDVDHVESLFFPFGDSVSVGAG